MKKRRIKLAIALAMLSVFSMPCYAKTEQSYVIDAEGEQQVIPLTYEVTDTWVSFPTRPDVLAEASDICVDEQDNIYVLDSGNSRVLRLSSEGKIIRELQFSGENGLTEAQGIFVDAQGIIYVADTGNRRILVVSEQGEVLQTLTQPEDSLFDKDYPFEPIKVGVNTLGQIYAINNLDYHGFCILDLDNEFKGYFAATRLEKNVVKDFIKKHASESQKEQMGKEIPAQHSNFLFAEDGSIYVTTQNVETAQMKHLSTVGNNFYPYTGAFGDETSDYLMKLQGKADSEQKFVDVCVDSNGIVSLLDNATGRIYQYDAAGNMLLVFGGTGSWSGRMMNAVAMAQDSTGNLYVLDQASGSIQKFESTDFTKMVHQALNLHQSGKYEEAGEVWQQVLNVAPEYPTAHIGLGKTKVKQKDYVTAMRQYKQAGDKTGYSDAFSKYLKVKIQNNFLKIVAILVVLLAAFVQIYRFIKERAKVYRASEKQYHEGKHIGMLAFFAPAEAFPLIKYDREKFDYKMPTLIVISAIIFGIAKLFVLHYPFAEQRVEDIMLLQEICGFFIPFVLWIAGLYYVTCIFSGEVKLREVYAATSYALLPYVVFTMPLALATNLVGSDGASYIHFFENVLWIWVILLVFISIKTMNHYTIGQTICVIIISIFAVLLLAVIMALIYLLGVKVCNFVVEVVKECKLNFI